MYDDLSKGIRNATLHTHDINPYHITDGYYPCRIVGASICTIKQTGHIAIVEKLRIVGQGIDFHGNKIPDVDCIGKTFGINDGDDERIDYRLYDHLVCIAMYEPDHDKYLNIRHIAADIIMPDSAIKTFAQCRIGGIETVFYVRITTVELPNTYKTVYEYVKHEDVKALGLEELNRS